MIQKIKNNKGIIIIILLAALLRFYGISRGDPMNDESLMAFRSIGMIDFDEAAWQTTPFEWFDPLVKFSPTVPDAYRIGTGIPWWAHLSWHDHPSLVFLVQHIFMSIFGDNVWAFRLPSAILGVLSVYLLYLIGKRLYDKRVGLFSALIYAITLNGIYISRTGMQEPYVIFFILTTLYLFLIALGPPAGRENYFIAAGIVLGLGTLAKYTPLFVVAPIVFTYLLLFQRASFKNKKFWTGVVLCFVVISPSIIYNIELYKAVGHFDFQLSTIFGQAHPAWQVQPGKDIGSIVDRISVFVPRMVATNSWTFLSLFVISILGFLFSLFRNTRESIKEHSFLIISLFCVTGLLLVIGPLFRFLTMLTPFLALCIGKCFSKKIFVARKSIVFAVATLVLLFETFYSWNNQIAYYPVGPEPWLASKVRYENYNWGYNELNNYFESEFKDKIPALTFDLRYQFLNELRDKALADGLQKEYQKYPVLVVYFGNFDQAGKLWTLDRLHIYHAWPIISLADYKDYLQKNGSDFFSKTGFANYYFVMPINSTHTPEFTKLVQGAKSIEIKNPRGDVAFIVYEQK